MAATALAGNAISVSLPLIGPGAGSVFTYGRFRQVANGAAPAGWALLITGLISNLVWILLIAFGATVSDSPAAAFGGLIGGVGILVMTVIGVWALRPPRSRSVVTRVAVRVVRVSQRLSGRPVGAPDAVTYDALSALSAFRMRGREWAQAISLSLVNWSTSVACLIMAILAVGASVPWSEVTLVFCAGAAASSFNLTPGGLGVTEAVLTAGLVAARLKTADALASVLVFRIFSFWLIVLVGWTIYFGLLRRKARGNAHL